MTPVLDAASPEWRPVVLSESEGAENPPRDINGRTWAQWVRFRRDLAIFRVRRKHDVTYRAIGQRYGISVERVRQICAKRQRIQHGKHVAHLQRVKEVSLTEEQKARRAAFWQAVSAAANAEWARIISTSAPPES